MTDGRLSRAAVTVLYSRSVLPDLYVSRLAATVLYRRTFTVDMSLSRQAVTVLWQVNGPASGATAWTEHVAGTTPLWWWKAQLFTGYMSIGDSWQFWPDETGHGYDSSTFVGAVHQRRALIPSAALNEYANVMDDTPSLALPVGATDPALFGATGTVLMVFQREVTDPAGMTSGDYFIQRADNGIYAWVDTVTENISLRAGGVEVKDAVTKAEYNDGQPHVLLLRWNGSAAELWWDWGLRATAGAVAAATSGYAWYFPAGGDAYSGQEIVYDDLVFWSRRLTDADIAALKAAYNAPKPPYTGPTLQWWDGAAEQLALVEGWWDGSSTQPLTLEGWWDGSSTQPLA